MTDYVGAIDIMFSLFFEKWKTLNTSVVGYIPAIEWKGAGAAKPDPTKFWVRVSQQTVTEEQSTFRSGEYGKRFTVNGLLFVQVFCPKNVSDSFSKGRALAQFIRNGFSGVTTYEGIMFRGVVIKELDDEANYKRLNVVAEYEYDEVRGVETATQPVPSGDPTKANYIVASDGTLLQAVLVDGFIEWRPATEASGQQSNVVVAEDGTEIQAVVSDGNLDWRINEQ